MSDYLDKNTSLTPFARRVIDDKATEPPGTGPYISATGMGTYLCRRCGIALFRGLSQFHSGCGWPSFDENIVQAVKQIADIDGRRTEILCARCDAHLGHVFTGEGHTRKNLRHCVNGAAIDFVADSHVLDTEEAIIAGGCFWGVDHFLRLVPGVLNVEAGYIGGSVANPTYEQVCGGNTGHYEAVRVVFDTSKADYHAIIKRFFEIHDPCDALGQGPDRGTQYQSAIFCYNDAQVKDATALIQGLQDRGYKVVTTLRDMQTFWPAEDYHQDYYARHSKLPYCHRPEPRFG